MMPSLYERKRFCSRFGWPVLFILIVAYVWIRILSAYSSRSSGIHSVRHPVREQVPYQMMDLKSAPTVHVDDGITVTPTNDRCTHYTCFDVYRCDALTGDRIKVYVYPIRRFVDSAGSLINEQMSRPFKHILSAITNSEYYTSDPETACLFVPAIDLLSQSYFRPEESSRILSSLSHWNSSHTKGRRGANHLLFNFIPGSYPSYNRRIDVHAGDALIAGSGADSWSFRSGFDVAIPLFSPFSIHWSKGRTGKWDSGKRAILLTVAQYEYVGEEKKRILRQLQDKDPEKVILITDRCPTNSVSESDYLRTSRCTHRASPVKYPDILTTSTFCLITSTAYLSTGLLSESLMTGCIPVILSDDMVLPFEEKIDWKKGSIRIREDLLPDTVSILSHISQQKVQRMRSYTSLVYQQYFHSIEAMTLTTLEIISERIMPFTIKRKDDDERCHGRDL